MSAAATTVFIVDDDFSVRHALARLVQSAGMRAEVFESLLGVVDRKAILDGSRVKKGDVLVGLPSTGLHTNGYSLARKILFEVLGHGVDSHLPELGTTVGEALLAEHRGYLAALEPLLEGPLDVEAAAAALAARPQRSESPSGDEAALAATAPSGPASILQK